MEFLLAEEGRVLNRIGELGQKANRPTDRTWTPPKPPPGGFGASSTKSTRDKVAEVIAALEAEQAQLGRTAREQAVYNALQKAGITDAAARADAVRAAAVALYDEERVVSRNVAAMDELRSATQDLASTIVDSFLEGKDAGEAFGDAIEGVAKRLLNSGIEGIIANLFGAAGTPGTGIVGSVAEALFGGARAAGGPVSPGKAYLVGERGPELIVPRGSETVVPNGRLREPGARGGGMSISVDVSGARGNTEIEAMVAAGVRRGLGEYDRTLPDRVTAIGRSPRRRGGT
jgi:hypothetical protein